MHRGTRVLCLLLGGMLLASLTLLAQRAPVRGGPPATGAGFAPAGFDSGPALPQFGGYGFSGLRNPSLDSSWYAPPYPAAYAPNYWWVSPYSTGEARQDGYNPDAGYEWGTVGALLLTTFPKKAQVTLDGTCVGTADRLGPFQLPVGAYTLRVEAAGYQPSITVVRFDKPDVRELDIVLKPLIAAAKAARRN